MPDQPVDIVDYDPSWPETFRDQQVRLSHVLSPWLAAPVEHIGSTSVPGLSAKPVVDILAPVTSLDAAADAIAVLEADGWWFWPDDPCRYYRLWFLRPSPQARTHHLHVIGHADVHVHALLAFRDALLASATVRDEYVQLKQDLAARHPTNRNAYSNAKSAFIERTLTRLGLQSPPRDPLPE